MINLPQKLFITFRVAIQIITVHISLQNCTMKLGYNERGYNELGYNELGYNELGYNERSVITNNNSVPNAHLLHKSIRLKRAPVITNPGYNEQIRPVLSCSL